MLTTNAKASGRRLTVTVIKDLDADTAGWLKEVVLKSQLLGQYDTMQTKWVSRDNDYQVKITGTTESKLQKTLKAETATPSSQAGSGEFPTTSGGVVKDEKFDGPRNGSGQSTQETPTQGDLEGEKDKTETQECALSNQQLADQLQRLEIQNRIKELEHAQLLRDAELANVRQGAV